MHAVGAFTRSAADDDRKDTRDYLAAAFPALNAWEQIARASCRERGEIWVDAAGGLGVPPGLREPFGVLGLRGGGRAREKRGIRESAVGAAVRRCALERGEIRIPRETRVPRHRRDVVAGELDDPRVRAAHVEDVERSAARPGEHAEVEGTAEARVFALVEGVPLRPARGREKDPVRGLDARAGERRERLRDGVERREHLIGARAQVREEALLAAEPLEDAERREDRREERDVRQRHADAPQAVAQLAEGGSAPP